MGQGWMGRRGREVGRGRGAPPAGQWLSPTTTHTPRPAAPRHVQRMSASLKGAALSPKRKGWQAEAAWRRGRARAPSLPTGALFFFSARSRLGRGLLFRMQSVTGPRRDARPTTPPPATHSPADRLAIDVGGGVGRRPGQGHRGGLTKRRCPGGAGRGAPSQGGGGVTVVNVKFAV